MQAAYGAFGKMPSLGDFFRLGLGPDFIDPWDRWLQASVTDARALLGGGFQAAYMSAPLWRFTLPPGLAGPLAMAGVLMASVDRVGRLFPLTLARPMPPGGNALSDHAALLAAVEPLEDAALDALSDDMTRDALSRRLAQCPAPLPAPLPPVHSYHLQGRALVPATAVATPRRSVWSSTTDRTTLVLADGLPEQLFAALIDPATVLDEGALHG